MTKNKNKSTLSESRPDYLQQWDYQKNTISPDDITTGSRKEIWWTCEHGHSWTASPGYRERGFGFCKQCLSISFLYPELTQEWDYQNNTEDPTKITPGSGKKVHWVCPRQHRYTMVVKSRTQNKQGCPYCAGQRVIPGETDLYSKRRDLARQWDYEKNEVTPHEVSYGSKKMFYWTDDCGHSWKMSLNHRIKIQDLSCPVCQSIAVIRPDWIEQWHPTKNTLSPEEVSPGSDKDIWWFNRDCGHEWLQSPWSKSVNKGGCQVCINKVVSPGFNDLATTHPEVAKQCTPDSPIQPHEITYGSSRKLEWQCDKGHSWISTVVYRIWGEGECPSCGFGSSIAEREIGDLIKSYDIDIVTSNRRIIRPYELDIYIPEKKIAIEFNGIYWHSEKMDKDRHYHLRKWEMCHEKGIQLITIWEDDWKTKKDIIVSMLLHKLGVSGNDRVPARKTEVVALDIETTRSFLDNHHIQGYTSGSIYLGLVPRGYPENRPVAVSVWKKNGSSLYLERYATSCIVPGGMGKLLKAGTLWGADNECIDIVTFADREVSDGGLYERLGFQIDKILEPDYTYLVNNARKHKFGYRLKRFKNDPELKYQEGLTEKQLADLNGLYRIWDQGKVRYVKKIK